jgi:hypothetical protein
MKLKLLVFLMMMLAHSFVSAQQDSIPLKEEVKDAEVMMILDLVERLPSLEELYELSFVNSPLFKSNKISNQIYRERILSEQWRHFDMLSFSPTGYIGQVPGEATFVNSTSSGGVSVAYGLSFGIHFNFGKFAVQTRTIRIAKLELDLFKTEQKQLFKQLKAEIALAYFTLLTESDNFSNSVHINESTFSLVYLAKKGFLDGEVSLSDYHHILVEEHRLLQINTTIKIRLKEAFYKLKLLVGGSFE